MKTVPLLLLTSAALILSPMAAAFLFPLRVIAPIPEPRPASPPIVYRLPPAQPNDLSGVAIRKQKGLVNMSMNASWDAPGYALHSFVAALKTYPRARRVRMSWYLQLPMNHANTTVLYDRRQRNVAFFSQGDGDLGAWRDHVLFTGVPEAVFVKLAEAHREDASETSWASFDDLPLYGCRRHDLGSWRKDSPG